VTLVGILNERDFEASISFRELKKVLFDTLQLGTMYGPLVDTLIKLGKVKTVTASDIEDLTATVDFREIAKAM
jgi:hypothetical protein